MLLRLLRKWCQWRGQHKWKVKQPEWENTEHKGELVLSFIGRMPRQKPANKVPKELNIITRKAKYKFNKNCHKFSPFAAMILGW